MSTTIATRSTVLTTAEIAKLLANCTPEERAIALRCRFGVKPVQIAQHVYRVPSLNREGVSYEVHEIWDRETGWYAYRCTCPSKSECWHSILTRNAIILGAYEPMPAVRKAPETSFEDFQELRHAGASLSEIAGERHG